MTTKLLIFGAGNAAEKLIHCFLEETEIVAFIDNDHKKWNSYFADYCILSPQEGIHKNYDYIIIAVFAGYEQIERQLCRIGVEKNQIVIPFSFQHEYYSQWRKFLNIEELIYLEMEQKIEKLSAHIENLEYELALKLKENVIIGCITHRGQLSIARGQSVIAVGDTVILITTHTGMHDIRDALK